MAAPPMKSQPLHNFSLSHLKWARKDSSPSSSHHHRFRRRDSPDQHRRSCPDPESEPETRPDNPKPQHNGSEEEKRLKLRPRKEAVKTAPSAKLGAADSDSDCKTRGNDNNGVKSQRIKGSECERNSKRRIWISLSKEEIEEDVYSLTGGKPARRPRKWPKNVQKQLDNVFPGLYLVGVSADSYRVMMLWYSIVCYEESYEKDTKTYEQRVGRKHDDLFLDSLFETLL